MSHAAKPRRGFETDASRSTTGTGSGGRNSTSLSAATSAQAAIAAARAAAMAACADVAALKDVLLRPPDPVPVVEREASVSKPRRGFAAWLNEIVDAELES